MKKYCLVKNGEITEIGGLPVNFENVSNFYLLSDDEIKNFGWLPVETISENKSIQVSIKYEITENSVKEIIETRDKTEEEIKEDEKEKNESKWYSIRFKRNNLLNESDYDVVSDKWENMSENEKSAISTYRKLLRNIPQDFSNPDDVVFPIKP